MLLIVLATEGDLRAELQIDSKSYLVLFEMWSDADQLLQEAGQAWVHL